jgi:hypothetical protein
MDEIWPEHVFGRMSLAQHKNVRLSFFPNSIPAALQYYYHHYNSSCRLCLTVCIQCASFHASFLANVFRFTSSCDLPVVPSLVRPVLDNHRIHLQNLPASPTSLGYSHIQLCYSFLSAAKAMFVFSFPPNCNS